MLSKHKERVPPCGDTLFCYIWLSDVYHYPCSNVFPSAFPENVTVFLLEAVRFIEIYLSFEAQETPINL